MRNMSGSSLAALACAALTAACGSIQEQCIEKYQDATAHASTDAVIYDCMSVGAACDPHDFISVNAATCIAGAAGLDETTESWKAGLRYDRDYPGPVWVIRNVLERHNNGCARGEEVELNAFDGTIVLKDPQCSPDEPRGWIECG